MPFANERIARWGATFGPGECRGLSPSDPFLGAVGQRLPAEEGEIEIDDDEYEEMVEGGAETGQVLDLSQFVCFFPASGLEAARVEARPAAACPFPTIGPHPASCIPAPAHRNSCNNATPT